MGEESAFVTTNYVQVEILSLAQQRSGRDAVRRIVEQINPVLSIGWVRESEHEAAIHAVLAASRRGLRLVDCTIFIVMRRLGLARGFTFDARFGEAGFQLAGLD